MKPEPNAPALVRPGALQTSIKVEPLTVSIGAQLVNVNTGTHVTMALPAGGLVFY